MRYDLTNNQTTPFITDIRAVYYVDVDRNEGLVFFVTSQDKIYKTNYMTHSELILIKNATGKLWTKVIIDNDISLYVMHFHLNKYFYILHVSLLENYITVVSVFFQIKLIYYQTG